MNSLVKINSGSTSRSDMNSGYDLDLQIAANLIYSALMHDKCEESRSLLERYLDHRSRTLNLNKLNTGLSKLVNKPSNKSSLSLQKGGTKLSFCIQMGLFVILLFTALYLFSRHLDEVHYKVTCGDIVTKFDYSEIMNSLYIQIKLAFNSERIAYCKTLKDKKLSKSFAIAKFINGYVEDWSTLIKQAGGLMVLLISILSGGAASLACLATEYLNLGEICKELCPEPRVQRATSNNGEDNS